MKTNPRDVIKSNIITVVFNPNETKIWLSINKEIKIDSIRLSKAVTRTSLISSEIRPAIKPPISQATIPT